MATAVEVPGYWIQELAFREALTVYDEVELEQKKAQREFSDREKREFAHAYLKRYPADYAARVIQQFPRAKEVKEQMNGQKTATS